MLAFAPAHVSANIQTGTVTTTQLNFVPATSTNVIAKINASAEGIQISGARIAISGSTTFASGYDPSLKIATGSAAQDVNANTTTINGPKITTGSITADRLNVTNLSAIAANIGGCTLSSSTITCGGSTLGSGGVALTSGSIALGSSFYVDNSGNMNVHSIPVFFNGASFENSGTTYIHNQLLTGNGIRIDSSIGGGSHYLCVGNDGFIYPGTPAC